MLVLPVDVSSLVDFIERRIQFVLSNGQRFVINLEALVEGVVQLPPDLVCGVGIERSRVGDEFEALAESFSADHEFSAGVGELGLDPITFSLDCVAAFEDFASIEQAVGSDVNEPQLTSL